MLKYWKIVQSIPSQVYLIGVILALSSTIAIMQRTYARKTMEGQLLVDSLVADADTTRVARALDDVQRQVFMRRAIQAEMKADALNKKLKTESSVRATLQFFVDSVYNGNADTNVDGLDGDTLPDVLNVEFNGYTPPFKVSGVTIIDFVEDTAGTKYSVVMDPFKIGMRVECSNKAINGVRQATVLVDAPLFVRVSLDTLRQSPDVCSPPPSVPIATSSNRNKLWTALGFGVGVYVGSKILK
jgi:hypothetical protein